ncbi:MAG: aminotransferase class I/II-fold pyridoxal phosphate-dependent enzyme [Candidatus Omnitrophica bacterium]|nr:aminotransferase class I/II-fold pyridoxal phosphate-dependent enzyme [Candidatus Omnitrophota bacterium]
MTIDYADRIKNLPPYLFEEIDIAKKKAVDAGRPVIDLGVGDPDTPTPDFIVRKMQEAVSDPANHRYAIGKGTRALRASMADWYKSRFGVTLDPETEVLALMGSKDGIGHFPLAFINPGDEVLVPDPGYPPYNSGTVFAGGRSNLMPLREENGFLPDLSVISEDTARRSKIMHLNYPNNPTGAVCDREFYGKVIDFARKNDIIVCADGAYTEMSFDGYQPLSFLEVEGAREVGVEFHSLSKTFNMTGWRIGMAVGNPELIAGLAKVKANLDSGVFTAVQIAAIEALDNAEKVKALMNPIYAERRDVLVNGLNDMGWKVNKPKATFYVWAPVLDGFDSTAMAKALLEKADIIATPGNGFGPSGEGYVRFALTRGKEQLAEAVDRIRKAFFS